MRMLHTSDWHLGATLNDFSREADHRQFLDWLTEVVVERQVELLVVAGDVFDQANPSAESQRLYYSFLRTLEQTPIRQVVVVGGNHDSASRLDAPAELLTRFKVHVVGGLDAHWETTLERCLCPVHDERGDLAAVIVAAPFVHEWRLGFRNLEGTPGERLETMSERFREFYRRLAELGEARAQGAPLIATGHLACLGSDRDDAPAEIHQVGTLGALPGSIFDPRFHYVALGHIHRNYAIEGTAARYSGSPIAMNIKEGRSPRFVNLVDFTPGGEVAVERLGIPATRPVLALAGTLEEVLKALSELTWTSPLPPMLCVELRVAAREVGLEETVRNHTAALDPRPVLVEVHQVQVRLTDAPPGEDAPLPRLQDLEPRDVFRLLCSARNENADELMAAFESLLSGEDRP